MQPEDKNSDFMQKVDLVKDKSKLKYSDIIYMKQAEEIAVQKALKYVNTRRKCNIAGVSLACLVIGIYAYTIHAVKQETFLDNLDEPEKVIEKPTSNANIS
ncbi:unnamed protein product [Xylocopa violacea]|uniref:Cytochrome c oxidase assembly factor 3 n=1 Tax=Xylocopa violacea TaxID=135666 RepID=A0ABP1P0F1_XYLVO